MLGSGERLTVAVIVDASDGVKSFPLLRPGVLNCLYGEQGEAAAAMIRTAAKMAMDLAAAKGIAAADPLLEGFYLDQARTTRAESGLAAARQAAALYSSLAKVGDKIAAISDEAVEDSATAKFARAVEELVVKRRHDLHPYFGKQATSVEGGHPIKFRFLSPHAAVQMSVFKSGQWSHGSGAARLRMWELMTVIEESERRGALIVKRPSAESAEMSVRAAKNLQAWLDQLYEEGDRRHIRVLPVESTESAADALIAFAGT